MIANAIKFTPEGGEVQICVERVDSQIELVVADTGEGIEADFLPHVFDRFRQADATTTRKHGGLGLGLSIVKHLVELHGGSVAATSAGSQRGMSLSVGSAARARAAATVGRLTDGFSFLFIDSFRPARTTAFGKFRCV